MGVGVGVVQYCLILQEAPRLLLGYILCFSLCFVSAHHGIVTQLSLASKSFCSHKCHYFAACEHARCMKHLSHRDRRGCAAFHTMDESKTGGAAADPRLRAKIREAFDLFDKEKHGTVIQECVTAGCCLARVSRRLPL